MVAAVEVGVVLSLEVALLLPQSGSRQVTALWLDPEPAPPRQRTHLGRHGALSSVCYMKTPTVEGQKAAGFCDVAAMTRALKTMIDDASSDFRFW